MFSVVDVKTEREFNGVDDDLVTKYQLVNLNTGERKWANQYEYQKYRCDGLIR
jgi:hypothetical protein